MLVILSIFIAVLLLFHFKLKYFTLYGPLPGLSPQFLFGNLLQTGVIHGTSLPQVYLSLRQRFGDIFQFWLGPWRVVVVSGLNDVQHIFNNRNVYEQGDIYIQQSSVLNPNGLIGLKDNKFKRHASIIAPVLRHSKVTDHLETILDCTDKLLNIWRNSPSEYVHVNIVQQTQDLLLAIFGLIGFNYDLETLDSDISAQKNEFVQAFRELLKPFDIALYLPSTLLAIYSKIHPRIRRLKATLHRNLFEIMKNELNESSELISRRKRTCLVASLVASLQTDEELEATKTEKEKKGIKY
ncbi:unnamed protein product [Rotaria sp. Silwood2]|nr:unnamed protein product [Rotaria sp. Silwood2]CAF4346478.1 unnamed protein product [Rotaria sp. Silwood2]